MDSTTIQEHTGHTVQVYQECVFSIFGLCDRPVVLTVHTFGIQLAMNLHKSSWSIVQDYMIPFTYSTYTYTN